MKWSTLAPGGGKLGSPVQGICCLARLHLHEHAGKLKALSSRKARESFPLSFDAEIRAALL